MGFLLFLIFYCGFIMVCVCVLAGWVLVVCFVGFVVALRLLADLWFFDC